MSANERIATLEVATGVELAPVDLTKRSGINLKGFSLITLCEVATERWGAASVDAWKKQSDLDLRVVTATTWFPLEYYYHLVEYLVATHLGGDPRAASELAATVARREINAFFRFVLSFTTPSMVMGVSARFWRSYYDGTELKVVASKSNWVHAEVRGWPLMSKTVAYEVAGALSEWMERSRAKAVRITALSFSQPGVLRIEATW